MPALSCVVIDDLYAAPLTVREHALSLAYTDAESEADRRYYRGRLSSPEHPFSPIGLRRISIALGRPLLCRRPTGEFRLLHARDPGDPHGCEWVHSDAIAERYAAIVYLNRPEQCRGGTAFYRHRELGLDRMPTAGPEAETIAAHLGLSPEALVDRLVADGHEPAEHWEPAGMVAMRFNRCVVFESSQFHARTDTFGDTPQTARLTQNFFFDVVDEPATRS
jgi:hypothetical protein